jgi:hypothetical protein
MSEGRLKQLIEDKVKISREHIYSPSAGEDEETAECYGKVDVADFTLKLLEEAKAEFLAINPFQEDYPHYDREIGDLSDDMQELSKWLKKWFGE